MSALVLACAAPPADVGMLSDGTDGSSAGEDSSTGNGQGMTGANTVTVTGASMTANPPSDSGGDSLDGTEGTASTGSDDAPSSTTAVECECALEQICTPDGCFGGQVFINFDGPLLVAGEDDAVADQTSIPGLAGQLQGFGGDAQDRAVLLEAVRAKFEGVSLYVTDERPTDGDYSMIVLGDNLGAFGDTYDVSPINCEHANPRPVSFVAAYDGDSLNVEVTAVFISHSIGHAIGLDHVTENSSIMGPFASGGNTFGDGCVDLAGGATCVAQHQTLCTAGQQDALGELQAIYGAG